MNDAAPEKDRRAFSKVYASWADVELAVHALVVAKSDIQQDTIKNTLLFMRFAAVRYPVPDDVRFGYWPTIRLCWSSGDSTCEIEINEREYEFYRFSDAASQISHVAATHDGFLDEVQVLLDEALLPMGGEVVG